MAEGPPCDSQVALSIEGQFGWRLSPPRGSHIASEVAATYDKKATAHCHEAKSVARHYLGAFRGPHVNEAPGAQEHDIDDGLTPV